MDYRTAKPSPILSGFIKHYWAMDNCLPNGEKHVQRIVPSGLLDIIFYLGDKPVSSRNSAPVPGNTMIAGHLNGYYDLEVTGKLSLFSILFNPHGLSLFLDMPIKELFDQNVPLSYIFKKEADELETRLYEAVSFGERIQIVEAFLLKQLERNSKKYHFSRIEHSLRLINRSGGLVSINQLAQVTCFSRKQFERVFSQYVGTTPKQFLKTVRFQHTIDQKSRQRSVNLTDLTYRCGYYDQAHMINDFRALTGMTPKLYFDGCEPYSDYFQGL